MPQSTGFLVEEEKNQVVTKTPLNEDEGDALGFYLRRAMYARDQRERPLRDFDGMTYTQDYRTNQDASVTFLAPKLNDQDVRINTATTEKKLEVLMNELLAMNIQPEVSAFDMLDREIVGLGKDFEHIVIRTNTWEMEDNVMVDIIRELLTQRAVFVEEYVRDDIAKNGAQRIKRAEKRVVSGLKMYLGDMTIPAYRFHEQPYIIKYDRVHYDTARARYQDNPKWAEVKPGGTAAVSLDMENLNGFRLNSLGQNEVEIIQYYSFIDNEYMEIVNGVMMHEPGEELPYDYEGYPFTMVSYKMIRSNFSYGRSPIVEAKTIQGLENETIRNLIRKFRQALEPPLGTQSKSIFPKGIWDPGNVTQGVAKDTFHKLVEHDGVTPSEFQMFDLISKITEEFTGVSKLQQGQTSSKRMTATESLTQLQQAMKNLGLAVLAVMRLRVSLTYLRLNTIINEFTKPIGDRVVPGTDEISKQYMQFTIPNVDLGNGARGKKVIQFRTTDLQPHEEQAIKDTEEQFEKTGEYIRIRTINIQKLNQFHISWYVTASQKPQAGSAVNKLLVESKIQQVAQIEQLSQGQVKGNWAELAQETELTWGSKSLFKIAAPSQLPPPETDPVQSGAQQLLGKINANSGRTGIASQLTESSAQQVRQPQMSNAGMQT